MEYHVIKPDSAEKSRVEALRALLPTAHRKYPNLAEWHYVLCIENGEALAYAAFYFKSEVMIVAEMGVHPAHQRKGNGSKVIAWLEYKVLQDKQHGIIIQQPGDFMPFFTDFGYEIKEGNAFKYWGKQELG